MSRTARRLIAAIATAGILGSLALSRGALDAAMAGLIRSSAQETAGGTHSK
jgi:hypothetical protein